MLKRSSFLLATLLLVSGSAFSQEENSGQNVKSFDAFAGRITGSKVRLRTQPNIEGYVIRETRNGEMFAVNGEDNDFYTIVPPKGTKGYVFRTFVLDGVIEGERVNVRLYPDVEAPIIGQLNKGDKIVAAISEVNNKWLEIDPPANAHFYIAKEYIEKLGPVEMIAQIEKRNQEAAHRLSSAFLFAQAEIQKSFEQIDLDSISHKFLSLAAEFTDMAEIAEKAKEANAIIQDIYVQKKIAFLENKTEGSYKKFELDPTQRDRLAKLGIDIKPAREEKNVHRIAHATSTSLGLASTFINENASEKMLIWQPLEESLFHLWAAARGEGTVEQFYENERENAAVLTGVIEPYSRPVKNRPGDYLLRCDNLPVAFLYSTRVDLEKLVGKKISIIAAPRPNNNFAFPAYYVLSLE